MKNSLVKWSSDKMTWYSWDEKCDLCGKITYGTRIGLATSVFPNINELDLCLNCCKSLLKKGDKYQDVKAMYFKKYIADVKEVEKAPWE